MRSNSGDDEARNNMHDPTVRDRTNKKEQSGSSKGTEARAPSDTRQGRKD